MSPDEMWGRNMLPYIEIERAPTAEPEDAGWLRNGRGGKRVPQVVTPDAPSVTFRYRRATGGLLPPRRPPPPARRPPGRVPSGASR